MGNPSFWSRLGHRTLVDQCLYSVRGASHALILVGRLGEARAVEQGAAKAANRAEALVAALVVLVVACRGHPGAVPCNLKFQVNALPMLITASVIMPMLPAGHDGIMQKKQR